MITYQEFVSRYRFDIHDPGCALGGGGFGQVYKAYDNETHRYVAIKRSEVSPQFKQFTLQREVELANSIPSHENIAQYDKCYRFENMGAEVDFAVLQYYEEGNLSRFVSQKSLTDLEKSQLIRGILQGLGHLHGNGFIHRDLKGGNILISREQGIWQPKIADFGLSKSTNNTADQSVFNSSIGISYYYAAPEQIFGDGKILSNVDLWAAGVLIYEIVNDGRLPFRSDNPDTTKQQLEVSEKVKHLILPDDMDSIAQPYDQMLARCWVTDIRQRVQTAEALLSILDNKGTEPPSTSGTGGQGRTRVKPNNAPDNGSGNGSNNSDDRPPPSDDTRVSGDSDNSGLDSGRGGGGQKKRRVAEVKEKKGMGPMVWVLLLLLIAGIIVGVVYVVNEQQERERARQEQADAVAQVEDAEQAKQAQAKQEKARQDKARKEKARKEKAKKDKARKDKARKAQANSGLSWVTVRGGTYQMGCKAGRDDDINWHACEDSEKPLHSVRVSSFKMSQYEVTNAQYAKFMNAVGVGRNGTYSKGGRYANEAYIKVSSSDCKISYSGGRFVVESGYEHHPVMVVTWYGARNYAKWVGGRLPTEEEWEYAARGGNKSKGYLFAGSNDIDKVAWYGGNSGRKTHPVGQKRPNELGLYDMSGNVDEWCESRWSNNYDSDRSSSYRMIRSGGCQGIAKHARASYRSPDHPTTAESDRGFRPVLSL